MRLGPDCIMLSLAVGMEAPTSGSLSGAPGRVSRPGAKVSLVKETSRAQLLGAKEPAS